ncbi:MAG: ATP-dependent RNA helicase DbpA [Gammaproteobacteria bacterium]
MTAFSLLPLTPEFLANLQALDYQKMTPIQVQSLPNILGGKDVKAQAKTGSGKTAAFGIGLLKKMDSQKYQTQSLVVCPTRELADQVCNEIRRLARPVANTKILTLCGGKPAASQRVSLERSPHIVVGTPGRILKHLEDEALILDHLTTLVLDEADRMLDMGFHDDIIKIISHTPAERQTLLFSATYSEEINRISKKLQNNPVDIQVESLHDNNKIEQVFYEVQKGNRSETLVSILHHYQPESSVVFCNTKQKCQELADELNYEGFHALALHGDLEQPERDQVLLQFSNKSSSLLIATDVASRGLDIKDLNAVINFELSPDPEIHIHRIGRTGRAEKQGLAISLFTVSEKNRVDAIEEYQNNSVSIEDAASLNRRKNFKLYPPMVTLGINGGRKNKIRAGDILGALTKNTDLPGKHIGKINIFDTKAYVAVEHLVVNQALKILSDGKIKGRKFRAWKV